MQFVCVGIFLYLCRHQLERQTVGGCFPMAVCIVKVKESLMF